MFKGSSTPRIIKKQIIQPYPLLMKSAVIHSSWSAFLFLDKLPSVNGTASFGVSALPWLGVSGVIALHERSQISSF